MRYDHYDEGKDGMSRGKTDALAFFVSLGIAVWLAVWWLSVHS